MVVGGAKLSAQPAPVQSVRFTVFAARPVTDLSFAPRPNAAPQAIAFYPTARSPRYEYRGTMPLRFTDAAGTVVAEASIPADIQDALLLFSPLDKPTGALKFQIAVLDDAAMRHAAGALAILNLSGLALSGAINGGNVTLHAGLNASMPVGRTAHIMLRTPARNRSYQAYADTVTLKANQRALLILFPPFYKGSLEVQSRLLIDEPPAATPARR